MDKLPITKAGELKLSEQLHHLKTKDRIEILFQYSELMDSRKVEVVGFGKWKGYKFNEI